MVGFFKFFWINIINCRFFFNKKRGIKWCLIKEGLLRNCFNNRCVCLVNYYFCNNLEVFEFDWRIIFYCIKGVVID